MRRPILAASPLMILTFAAAAAAGDHWPQWRGPNRTGVVQAKDLPTTWSKDSNVRWRLPLPGPAGATPVVWGERIFLSAVDGDQLVLMCVGVDGKTRWKRQVGSGNRNVRGDEGNSASPSPVTDGKHVWCFMANGALACFTVAGEPVWDLDVNERFGKLRIAFGMTSTPVLDRERLYLQLIHGEGNPKTREAQIVALDALTGQEAWRHSRASDAVKECEHSYASPILYEDDERRFLIAHGADYVTAHDLETGRELWRCGAMNRKSNYDPTLRFVASPAAVPGLIVVPSAKNGPVLALTPDGEGDVTQSKQRKWTLERNTPDVPSPLIHDGLVYLCRENGVLMCLDAETGEVLYQERVHGQRHRASPVLADGKLYLSARDGRVSVVQAGREYRLLAQNDLEESLSASPAIAGGVIYLRTFDALYAIARP